MTTKKDIPDEEWKRGLRDNMPDGWRWFNAKYHIVELIASQSSVSFEATAENAFLGFQNLKNLERQAGYLNDCWKRLVSCTVKLSPSKANAYLVSFHRM